jgi:hypothetical protein
MEAHSTIQRLAVERESAPPFGKHFHFRDERLSFEPARKHGR